MIDVKTMKTAELVNYYNAHSGKAPVKKFADRATAEKRVAALLPTPASSSKKTKGVKTPRTRVSVDGTQYNSVGDAFLRLKLPMGRAIKFRMNLKKEGTLKFEDHTFSVVK